jgi:uncharacterized protein YbjT (DUF2867 family)
VQGELKKGNNPQMRVILFGATGMVGQGVLRECLSDPHVERVLTIGRTVTGWPDAKLKEIVHKDFLNFTPIEAGLSGYDACFFCLGVSAIGMSEAEYRQVTYSYAMAAAETLVRLNPEMTFEYISGAGTDSSENGRTRWARVKGMTENALMGLPFKAVYALRPGYIQPMHGIKSKTIWYQALYTLMAPLYPIWNAMLPSYVTTTEKLGRAMIAIAKRGAPKRVLENRDINALG